MKYLKILIVTLIPLVLITAPVLVLGQGDGGLVNCAGEKGATVNGRELPPCDFNLFLGLIKIIINYLIGIAAVVATIVIVVAGIWLATAGGNDSRRSQATKMLTAAVIGLLVVLAAWLIVQAIILALVGDSGIGRSLRGIFPE